MSELKKFQVQSAGALQLILLALPQQLANPESVEQCG